MKKKLLAFFLILGMILTQLPALSVAAQETSFFGVLITDADGKGNASGSSYMMFYPGMEGESSRTSSSNNFVENGDGVFLQAYPADGYKFLGWYQGDPDKADGKLYTGEPLTLDRTYEFTAPIGLERPYVCAVFDADDSPQADQVQMWVGNIVATPGGSSAQGGKVAVKYTPSYDVYPNIKAKDGKQFVYGEVLQFYKGDECTVYQQPDPGYRFVGWYHANSENTGGLFYEGDPISTEDTFTYKPGKTVVPGDTEPLRYVCAVFEPIDLVEMHVWTEGHGKVLVNGTDYGTEFQGTWYEDTEVQVEAVPDEDYKFARWLIRKNSGSGALVHDAVTTLVAGTEYEANAAFGLETAYVTITPPEAGTTAATAPQITLPEGAGYSLDTLPWGGPAAYWTTSESLSTSYPEDLDESTVFEPGQTYYAYVRLADGEDSFAARAGGSSFDTDLEVSGGKKMDQGNFAAWAEEHGNYMGIMAIIAVTIPEADTHTVTFDAQGGTPVPAPQTIASGGKASMPADPSREDWGFRGWYTDKVYTEDNKFDFDTPVTEDMTLYAGWYKMHMLIPYDITKKAPGGGAISYDGSDPVAGSIFMFTAFDGETHTLAATPNEGYEFVGWSTSNSEDDVFSTDAEYTYESKDASDWFALFSEKTATVTLTLHWSSIDGVDLADPIVIENIEKGTKVYEALGTIDLNMMSKPFEKEGYIADNYKLPKPITEYADYDAMEDDWVDAFAPIESNMDIYCIMMKAIDEAEITFEGPLCGTETTTPSYTIDGIDGDFWRWGQQTNKPVFSVPEGKNYHADPSDWASAWFADETGDAPYIGTFTGGEKYYGQAWLEADFGYTFASDDPDAVDAVYSGTATVNDAEFVETHYDWDFLGIEVLITAVHDPAEAVEENRVEPTCVTPGSYDEVVYCKGCGAELNRETKEIPATGHTPGNPVKENEVAPTCTAGGGYDEVVCCEICGEELSRSSLEIPPLGHAWGEWIQTTAPTCKEPGKETHTCTRCGETETREVAALGHAWGEWIVDKEATEEEAGHRYHLCSRCGEKEEEVIPMIVASYGVVEGDGATWYTGSNDSLTFTFKRSVNDAVTFENFQRIEIDGKEVALANYEAKAGSVIITLKPEYIKTLAAGKHTLKAVFENGKTADATFTIAEKKADVVPGGDSAKKETGVKTGDNANTGLFIGLGAAALLIIAAVLILMKRRSRNEK